MPTTTCSDCGATVSTRTLSCPACGAPTAVRARRSQWWVALVALALLLVGGLFLANLAADDAAEIDCVTITQTDC